MHLDKFTRHLQDILIVRRGVAPKHLWVLFYSFQNITNPSWCTVHSVPNSCPTPNTTIHKYIKGEESSNCKSSNVANGNFIINNSECPMKNKSHEFYLLLSWIGFISELGKREIFFKYWIWYIITFMCSIGKVFRI